MYLSSTDLNPRIMNTGHACLNNKDYLPNRFESTDYGSRDTVFPIAWNTSPQPIWIHRLWTQVIVSTK